MSRHKECGKEIRWSHREDDHNKWMPPLEFAGQAYVFLESSDTAVLTTIYKRHDCDPDDMIAWQEYIARVAELKEQRIDTRPVSDAYIAGREMDRMKSNQYAEEVACPRELCKQPIGAPCLNITVLKKTGEEVFTRSSHPERLTKRQKTESP